ncbi:MAG: adenine phosphoribosyltransferase [Candidatus Nitrosotenuis sp.]|uniref:Adenine phosphoribosyltransferase n=1 Tax=Candidatus Nitrosotenuis uzonensis TaxID=1407055 RepID=V6AU76_9ARCH|nr:adenine phosphoribosyltransferase [Candidatus Nitrosotenuis uzonensis]CAE6495600.1 Adenine phosphoribosyltransferase [Candidatus Nitrosotenuis uzonensis]CDI06100.1 Adenine phosphoribosyltransferase [Candidatus Nitrosotenuis uzonensis]
MNLQNIITEYPNFPKKGILFRDISPILKNPAALSHVVDEFAKKFHTNDVDIFAGIESRGFPLACAMALRYNKGMIMIRKQGKLPGSTVKRSYNIEYGKATMEIQRNAVNKDQRVVICDDLLATGGTAKAAAELIEKLGGQVAGFAFIVELTDLQGIKKIEKYKCESLVRY